MNEHKSTDLPDEPRTGRSMLATEAARYQSGNRAGETFSRIRRDLLQQPGFDIEEKRAGVGPVAVSEGTSEQQVIRCEVNAPRPDSQRVNPRQNQLDAATELSREARTARGTECGPGGDMGRPPDTGTA